MWHGGRRQVNDYMAVVSLSLFIVWLSATLLNLHLAPLTKVVSADLSYNQGTLITH